MSRPTLKSTHCRPRTDACGPRTPRAPLLNSRRDDFHRLTRASPLYRWWRPLAELGLFAAGLAVLMMVLLIIGVALDAGNPGSFEAFLGSDLRDPYAFGSLTITLILMIPASWLAVRIGGKRRWRYIFGAGPFRWRLLAGCLGLAIFTCGSTIASTLLIRGGPPPLPSLPTQTAALMIAITLVLVPLQSLAEEIIFRGLLPQILGAWIRPALVAFLLPVPLFVLGHSYDPIGLLGILLFAVVTAVLTWRTGGLEAAIALHVINNVLLFLLVPSGLVNPNQVTIAPLQVLISAIFMLLYVVIILGVTSRSGTREGWAARIGPLVVGRSRLSPVRRSR